jgi:hypothetical protein
MQRRTIMLEEYSDAFNSYNKSVRSVMGSYWADCGWTYEERQKFSQINSLGFFPPGKFPFHFPPLHLSGIDSIPIYLDVNWQDCYELIFDRLSLLESGVEMVIKGEQVCLIGFFFPPHGMMYFNKN